MAARIEEIIVAKKHLFADMPITAALSQWLKQEDWKDEISVREDRKFAEVATTVNINEQTHRMYLEADETAEWISVFVYSPIKVPTAKIGEMARLINRVNMRITLGRLACPDIDEACPVQFLVRIDVEGGVVTPNQIDTMVGVSWEVFRMYGPMITAVALTKQSEAACWAEFLEEEAVAEKAKQDDGSNDP